MSEQEQLREQFLNQERDSVGSSNHSRGEMIAICSPKGGVGKTVLAINLAVALSKRNIKTALLDGDFQFGDVTLCMDLNDSFSIKDLDDELEELDDFTLDSHMLRHESGVKVLAAPDRPEYAETITPIVIEKVTRILLGMYDYVIVDTGVGFQDQNLHLLEKADQILVLTNLEMSTLKNTKLFVETLEILGLREKARVVINRATMDSVIKASEVPDILGEEAPIFIPNEPQMVSQSLNTGIPFVTSFPKSDMAKSLHQMAEQLSSRREISFLETKETSLLKSMFRKTFLKERT
ncbi:AAA family ATPase [Caldalkalibacillus salinus]|uniref:AAA family ATPase n=1 Tax=Caldalkalibacillus salinus TaxID=2803787 RepID=UPI0019212798|nr:P-loop NTPase [Caldalkalibacillus salinus]